MLDVFVSYARSTEDEARRLTEALQSRGYDVWRDDQLPAHRAYGEVIEERLKSAKAVIVVWSLDALRSQWVRAEADAAREAGTLVQLSVDGTMPAQADALFGFDQGSVNEDRMLNHGVEHFIVGHVGASQAQFFGQRLLGAQAFAGRDARLVV